MDISKFGWIRKEQEQDGDYWFDGKLFVTRGVNEQLSEIEIHLLIGDGINLAAQQGGCDYLIVYQNEKRGLRLYFIDQVTRQELADGIHPEEHHYATLLLDIEY